MGSQTQRREVADAYGAYYEEIGDAVPASYRDGSYRDRIEAAYPFHPELIDILTNRWGSLVWLPANPRGASCLAHTVKGLAQRNLRRH